MISLHFSKLIKLDNKANVLRFQLALLQVLCTCVIKDSLLSMVIPNSLLLLLFFILSSPIEIPLSALFVIRR